MEHIKTHYCRDRWNDLIRIGIDNIDNIDKNTLYFELGYCLKKSSIPIFKWKYKVDINYGNYSNCSNYSNYSNYSNDTITLNCINIVDKEIYISQDEVKYNMWHTLRCEKLEENFSKFASDLQQNFPKEEWIQIIIEVFPSISSYPKKNCDFEDYDVYEDILAKDWIKNKRQENWED